MPDILTAEGSDGSEDALPLRIVLIREVFPEMGSPALTPQDAASRMMPATLAAERSSIRSISSLPLSSEEEMEASC